MTPRLASYVPSLSLFLVSCFLFLLSCFLFFCSLFSFFFFFFFFFFLLLAVFVGFFLCFIIIISIIINTFVESFVTSRKMFGQEELTTQRVAPQVKIQWKSRESRRNLGFRIFTGSATGPPKILFSPTILWNLNQSTYSAPFSIILHDSFLSRIFDTPLSWVPPDCPFVELPANWQILYRARWSVVWV